MKRLLLLSSSAFHGHPYLQFAANDIKDFFESCNVKKVLFIPYALKDYNAYTKKVKTAFEQFGLEIYGIHEQPSATKAVEEAKGVFIGGGNTFLLLKTLYDHNLVKILRDRVLWGQLAYMGASAGTNVATLNICTTNDMPIVYPPSFDALNLVPFNINPHYIEPDKNSTHKGETRDERIYQYLEFNPNAANVTVIGLREGCLLDIKGNKILHKGPSTLKIFKLDKEAQELNSSEDISYIFS